MPIIIIVNYNSTIRVSNIESFLWKLENIKNYLVNENKMLKFSKNLVINFRKQSL